MGLGSVLPLSRCRHRVGAAHLCLKPHTGDFAICILTFPRRTGSTALWCGWPLATGSCWTSETLGVLSIPMTYVNIGHIMGGEVTCPLDPVPLPASVPTPVKWGPLSKTHWCAAGPQAPGLPCCPPAHPTSGSAGVLCSTSSRDLNGSVEEERRRERDAINCGLISCFYANQTAVDLAALNNPQPPP